MSNTTSPISNNSLESKNIFKFLSYHFDRTSFSATFVYQGIDNTIFTENVTFDKHSDTNHKRFNPLNNPELDKLLDHALFLAFVLLGTSYYKSHPTTLVSLPKKIDNWQANFFNKVYQEGLSQYAFENHLTRKQLAHFQPTTTISDHPIDYQGYGVISLQSGGKDSLLVASLLNESQINFTPWYVSSSPDGKHPEVIDNLFPQLIKKDASIAIRQIDQFHLQQTKGLNGHVPVTYINESLAIIQAILNNQNIILAGIGQEGTEPHSYIEDLAVNHQWSKTWEAELLLAEYVKRYISHNIHIGSPIRKYSELRIAELFINKCWQRYGYQFSSCNNANYRQKTDNSRLTWCGTCPKCANTYLLFCPFLPPHLLQTLFNDTDLFQKPSLTNTFKGLLGIGQETKPFECVGTYEELRFAYHHRIKTEPNSLSISQNPYHRSKNITDRLIQLSENLGINRWFKKASSQKSQKNNSYPPFYADLPFLVPESNFDYAKEHNCQSFFNNFFEDYKKDHSTKQS